MTRYFAVARPTVFDAWIQTSKVELWWGCGVATEVRSEVEPKIGGRYHHSMTLEGAGEYQHHGLITEYEPPALLAYEFVDPMSKQKWLFVWSSLPKKRHDRAADPAQSVDEHSQFVKAGWSSAFEALAPLFRDGRRTAPTSINQEIRYESGHFPT